MTLGRNSIQREKNNETAAVSRPSDQLTSDDVDVGVRVLAQFHAVAVPLERLAKLLLHGRRATQAIEAHHLDTHAEAGGSCKQNVCQRGVTLASFTEKPNNLLWKSKRLL